MRKFTEKKWFSFLSLCLVSFTVTLLLLFLFFITFLSLDEPSSPASGMWIVFAWVVFPPAFIMSMISFSALKKKFQLASLHGLVITITTLIITSALTIWWIPLFLFGDVIFK